MDFNAFLRKVDELGFPLDLIRVNVKWGSSIVRLIAGRDPHTIVMVHEGTRERFTTWWYDRTVSFEGMESIKAIRKLGGAEIFITLPDLDD